MARAAASSEELAVGLARRIRAEGPLRLDDFMAASSECYYAARDPLGAHGDFITAPEVSQMFGELVGAWCVDLWQRMGAPQPFVLAELGPGRGTLMQDALRAAAPDFLRAMRLHLVERSPVLRAAQEEALQTYAPTWHGNAAELPPGPLILVANEFLDALPIRQFERGSDGWRERRVGLDADGGFTWILGPTTLEFEDAPQGAVREICFAGRALARRLGARLAATGGAALFIDYGHGAEGFGDTLQAVRRHLPCAVLDRPGTADLTSHVDFASFAPAAAPARAWGPVTQRAFLRSLGIEVRATRLAERATDVQVEAIRAALDRLIGPGSMGHHFKALALTHPDGPAPAGF
jgi:NADH dehydrogenase [ubiquinone] 1 alpha subcomplex assembly factor 7